MRFLHSLVELALVELAASHVIQLHTEDASNVIAIREEAVVAQAAAPAAAGDDHGEGWHPKTRQPHLFNLRANDRCDRWHKPFPETKKSQCPFDSYAIRLEKGPSTRGLVSKEPLQLYVDAVTGAVKYTKFGWLPPSAISTGWYHTGSNPIQIVDPSPSYLTWPSTYDITEGGKFAFCPLGSTGQYQVFVNNFKFDSQGVAKRRCKYYQLAALNANPWKQQGSSPSQGDGHGYDHDNDQDNSD
ncbi:hypothetical protein BU23DRAFT_600220 [Bimuria novae-zelandiae CBS 107.79]|uniref:Uncharacterized protein n=1 Tax=Bimuria novae-zelandiae CBS 107.79 TaxID=1447943 RepID=A0A6A5V5Z7_9PLEO|nr:hypothetical protein BU23DRAFT_600220 [Bimuria novae-zelandiae CBS 107.79]